MTCQPSGVSRVFTEDPQPVLTLQWVGIITAANVLVVAGPQRSCFYVCISPGIPGRNPA